MNKDTGVSLINYKFNKELTNIKELKFVSFIKSHDRTLFFFTILGVIDLICINVGDNIFKLSLLFFFLFALETFSQLYIIIRVQNLD